MWDDVLITKDDAAAALRAAAFETEEELWAVEGAEVATRLRWRTTYSRPYSIVHSRLGGFGADHDLEYALARVEEADQVFWTTSLLGHDLAVVVGDSVYCYAVQRPERTATFQALVDTKGGTT